VHASINDVDNLLSKTGIKPEEIDLFLLHQANLRIIESIRTHLGQPKEKFPTSLQRYGNTSSASIPILMDELSREGVLKDGMTIMLSAFGGGFVSAAAILKWNKIEY
jgi:3-oxoacyl-[acyl-carrier-protein] synthase-3